MQRFVCVTILVLGACRSSSGTAKPEPAAEGPSCETVAAKMTEITRATVVRGGADEDTAKAITADARELEPQIAKLCADDAWTLELRTCIDEKPALEAAECESLATPAQIENMTKLRSAQEPPDTDERVE